MSDNEVLDKLSEIDEFFLRLLQDAQGTDEERIEISRSFIIAAQIIWRWHGRGKTFKFIKDTIRKQDVPLVEGEWIKAQHQLLLKMLHKCRCKLEDLRNRIIDAGFYEDASFLEDKHNADA